MTLQQLGPGWFVIEELWTRGSILRHLRVDKREKDNFGSSHSLGSIYFLSPRRRVWPNVKCQSIWEVFPDYE